jgi:hypothetical protein
VSATILLHVRGPPLDPINRLIFDFINFKVQDLPKNLTLTLNSFTTFTIKPAFLIFPAVATLTSAPISSTPESAAASS